MNIINHSSDDIRQIVPADFSFLSDADQQVTLALQHLLDRLSGTSGGTYILSGCGLTTDPDDHAYTPTPYRTSVDGGVPAYYTDHDLSSHESTVADTYTYHIADGTLLHGGKIYTLHGGDFGFSTYVDNHFTTPIFPVSSTGFIVFGSVAAAPSPVYGEDLQLSQNPHQSLAATVATGTEQYVIDNGTTNIVLTYTVPGNPTDFVCVKNLIKIPKVADFPFQR